GLTGSSETGLPESNVFLEVSVEDKVRRIIDQACDVFVDDLPELLLHPEFPTEIERICFDPANRCVEPGLLCVTAWSELTARWFGGEGT
ncbi:MAG: hypothetical protein ABI614_29070, partial [Planctomycetota bacterium]